MEARELSEALEILGALLEERDLGGTGKHRDDLEALQPTTDDLIRAARWTRTHDPSAGFHGELRRVLRSLGVEVGDALA